MPPLTCKEARELGISRRHLYSSAYRQLYRGVFVPADEPLTVATWTNAARLILPTDAQPTGLTALQLAGVDLGQPLPLHFATATAAEQSSDQHEDKIAATADAMEAADPDLYPNLAAIDTKLLFSGDGVERFNWAVNVLIDGVLAAVPPTSGGSPVFRRS